MRLAIRAEGERRSHIRLRFASATGQEILDNPATVFSGGTLGVRSGGKRARADSPLDCDVRVLSPKPRGCRCPHVSQHLGLLNAVRRCCAYGRRTSRTIVISAKTRGNSVHTATVNSARKRVTENPHQSDSREYLLQDLQLLRPLLRGQREHTGDISTRTSETCDMSLLTIGIVRVARLAALRLASGPPVTITSTFCRTRSAAIAEISLESFGI